MWCFPYALKHIGLHWGNTFTHIHKKNSTFHFRRLPLPAEGVRGAYSAMGVVRDQTPRITRAFWVLRWHSNACSVSQTDCISRCQVARHALSVTLFLVSLQQRAIRCCSSFHHFMIWIFFPKKNAFQQQTTSIWCASQSRWAGKRWFRQRNAPERGNEGPCLKHGAQGKRRVGQQIKWPLRG